MSFKRICPICNQEFITESNRQTYCNREVEKECAVCGKLFTVLCKPNQVTTCADPNCKRRASKAALAERRCELCNNSFIPKSARQRYCNKPIKKTCLICGKEFDGVCSAESNKVRTCSLECGEALAARLRVKERKERICSLCGLSFIPQALDQTVCNRPHFKTCKACGDIFEYSSNRQAYCNNTKERVCPVCGKSFTYVCNGSDARSTCSPECAAKQVVASRQLSISKQTRICKWCGKEFVPKEWRDAYCDGPHYKTCVICGKTVEFDPRKHRIEESRTCSPKCRYKLQKRNTNLDQMVENLKKSMLEKYGVINPMQLSYTLDKIKQTNEERYGCTWYAQTDEYKERVKLTDLAKYGVSHHSSAPDVINKRIQTNLAKYGTENVFAADEVKAKVRSTMIRKYGVTNPSQHAESKRKATAAARFSKLELRICNLLDNYKIEYIHHYFLKNDTLSHEFDFYIPKYKLLIDADGLYYHSYLDDPDGVRVREDYDAVRLKLIPDDHIFHVIVEGQEDNQIKELIEVLESVSGNLAEYDSYLFEWCRSIDFPYPNYTEKRMLSDWRHLNQYQNDSYVPQCRIGQSLIRHFHKSLFDCHVGTCLSPKEGWNNDDKLKQVIRNRFIYKNTVDPSKVLSGFTVSKLCPVVSTFNPVLARYLTKKYLAKFNTVFDPFSGFSGRLIGVASTKKQYIGQDLNPISVSEANQIIHFLNLDCNEYKVTEADILQSYGSYDCLLTCPPYGKKEIYNSETVFKSCDEWIDECLARFECNRYVFVVDNTDKYKDNIVEEISNKSHFSDAKEYVVVIDAKSL